MSATTMGKVLVTAKIENLSDLHLAETGHLPVSEVRQLEVTDALVDTGATALSLPRRMIQQLGLKPLKRRRARTSAGVIDVQVYSAARLTIQGRDCVGDVTELPD